jgi:hypothetical protein
MKSLRWCLLCATVLLAGCAQPPPPQVAGPPPKPEPKMVWHKDGAWTQEEFQRTKARCIMLAEMNDPYKFVIIAETCMRSEGWVRVPEQPPR